MRARMYRGYRIRFVQHPSLCQYSIELGNRRIVWADSEAGAMVIIDDMIDRLHRARRDDVIRSQS